MPGLVAGIHVFKTAAKTWMAGTQLRQGFAGLSQCWSTEALAKAGKSGRDGEQETKRPRQMTLLAKISTATDERSARLAGIGLMLLSIFMFSFGDALGKFMVATYSVGQLLWLRACAALLVLLPMICGSARNS
jgi:hypothetical protein